MTAADRPELPEAPDALAVLGQLGAKVTPDLAAYAAGELPAHLVRCVLCGRGPCVCVQCPAVYRNRYAAVTGRPESEVCGMTVDPASGECPRGHRYDPEGDPR